MLDGNSRAAKRRRAVTDDLVKRPDDEQDDLTLVYMWAYKMAEKKYKSRIEEMEAALDDVATHLPRAEWHYLKDETLITIGEKKDD
jgi:hypothetical protein